MTADAFLDVVLYAALVAAIVLFIAWRVAVDGRRNALALRDQERARAADLRAAISAHERKHGHRVDLMSFTAALRLDERMRRPPRSG